MYRLMRRATSLIHTSEINILLNLPSIILVLIFVNVKTSAVVETVTSETRPRPVSNCETETFL